MSSKLTIEFMGSLTKFQAKSSAVRQFQVKTICGDEDSEITSMVREIESWARNHLVDELNDFQAIAPSTAVAWSNLPVPLADYGMYFDVDFGQDVYSGEHGIQFKAQLTEIKFTKNKKTGLRSAVMTFVKNGESGDDALQYTYFKLKEPNDKGKMVPAPVKIVLTECDSFFIGDESEAKKDDDDTGVDPVVFATV